MDFSVSLEQLRQECSGCEGCELSKTRTNVVFGEGNNDADIMFIGEAPGKNEDQSGKPFVGRSGKLLDSFLFEIGLSRKNVYIANTIKCRPPENRDPTLLEQQRCLEYLTRQISIIQPKIIVCLGRIAAQRVISKKFSVTKQHGQFIEQDNKIFMGTYHPAAILRNPKNKPLAMDDFKALSQKLKEI